MSWSSALPSEVRREFAIAQRRGRMIVAPEALDLPPLPRAVSGVLPTHPRRRVVDAKGAA